MLKYSECNEEWEVKVKTWNKRVSGGKLLLSTHFAALVCGV